MGFPTGHVDHFPSTHRTWIHSQLTIIDADPGSTDAAGAERELRSFIMDRYYSALCAYAGAPTLRDLGEPADIVGSFFAHALESPSLLTRWSTSGISLRRWLMNAMAFHCRSLRRDRQRTSHRDLQAAHELAPLTAPAHDHTAERAFDRAWAMAVANEAHEVARATCVERGRDSDYEAFRSHVVDNLEHAEIAQRLGITRSQSVNAVRRVSELMRDAVRDLLRADGVDPRDLSAAVAELIELASEGGA